jgi:hypothetical protein
MMRRRKFLEYGGWLAAGLLMGLPSLAGSRIAGGSLVKGRVRSGKKGLAGVVVSDGFTVVATDAKGRFEFNADPRADFVFISTPSGYAFPEEDQVARHYRALAQDRKEIEFNLKALNRSDDEHRFIIWADPQVKNAKDIEKMMSQSVPDVQKLVAAAGPGVLFHGITVGDIVWDELQLFNDYERAVEKMGIPFFQCLGNHDMDYNQGGDDSSDKTFKKQFGPTAYSFNRGQVHYVVMDDVRYLGKDREYDGYISREQLDWLKKDLSFVDHDKLIVLCVHIPVHNGVKNNQALYDILGGRTVHIMSGHTHYHLNVEKGNIYEHNHGTVCGAWWTGPICGDGTPCGYGVYEVKGRELRWQYKSTGQSPDHQMKLFTRDNSGQKQVLLNVWDHDPAWRVEYSLDGKDFLEMEQTEGFDPDAYASLLGPELPKPRGFAEPRKTRHLFRASIGREVKEITVKATDRFGRIYQKTQGV